MNPVQQLEQWIVAVFGSKVATILEHPPILLDAGVWWLDVTYPVGRLVLQWSQSSDFGLSNIKPEDDRGYGEGPDEAFDNIKGVQERLTNILT